VLVVRLERIIVQVPVSRDRLDVAGWFDRPGPLELEIGVGKGGFLLRRARKNPAGNFLGIEWANKYLRYAADRMARWGVDNVRLLRTDARHFVTHNLSPACLAAIHVFHPDPWPKRRHHKRRLFQPPFVAAAAEALTAGGLLYVQTDHTEYFEAIRNLLAARPDLVPADNDIEPAEAPRTNYEIKYRREGRPIYRIAVRKRG